MLGISTALSFLSGGGVPVGGGGDTGGGPDPTPAVLPVTVTARWHPAFSATTLDGPRIATATDLTGLAAVSAPLGQGPKAMTDALGRAFWRFEGDSYLEIADALSLSTREISVFMVGRFHQVQSRTALISLGRNATTAPNTVSAALEASQSGNNAPLLRAFAGPTTNASYPTPEKMVTGSQMQVVGMIGRKPRDGDNILWMNETQLTFSQSIRRVSNVPGGEIGRYAHNPGSAGSWGKFDLYEMIVVDTALAPQDGDAMVNTLMAAYGIVPVTNQLVLDGDSIMQGSGAVTSGLAANMVLTDPGAGLLGPDWRVVNMASTGSRINKLIDRRNADYGWARFTLPGDNVLAFEVGRNDLSGSGGQNPAQHYANVVDYLTDDFGISTSSILDRGWDVRVMVNIASTAALAPNINAYRALLRDPAFAIDTQTDAGSLYAGQVQLVDTDLITIIGDPVFATPADAADITYYAGDSKRPNILGNRLRITGGDTPAYGVAFGL